MRNQNARQAAAELLVAGEPGTDQQNTEDFSFLIWRAIFRATVRNEKMAVERRETVAFEIEVMERELLLPGEVRSIIKLQLECEPGKPPRLLCSRMTQCGSPERIANRNEKARSKQL